MIHKIYSTKKIRLLFYLLLITFFISCEKDFYEECIIKENKIRIEEKSLNSLLQTNHFKNAYQKVEESKISKKKLIQGKTTLENEYNFTIVNDSPIKIITDLDINSTTYIMLIERDTSEYLKFENLILSEENGELEARIMKYTLSKPAEKELVHGGDVIEIIDKDITNLEIDGKLSRPCTITYTLMCDDTRGGYSHNHTATSVCIQYSNNLYMVTAYECGSGGNGDADNSDGGTTGTGNNGNNGNNTGPNTNGGGTTPTIPNSPIPCFDCYTPQKEPCDVLNKILQTPTSLPSGAISIKAALQDLIQNATNPNYDKSHEEGYNFAYSATTGQMFAVPADYSGTNLVRYNHINPFVFGGAHYHTEVFLEPMFSHDDIYVLNQFNTQFNIPSVTNSDLSPLPMHLLVTADGNVYALMAENMQAFSELINSIYSNEISRDKFSDNLISNYKKLFNAFQNSYADESKYQQALLEFMNDANAFQGSGFGNLNLKLYQVTKTGSQLSGWQELKLKQTSPTNLSNFTVDKIKCN